MGHEYLTSDEDHAEVVKRELLLLNPAVRSDPDRVREYMHPDFLEFGKSGRRWDLEAVVEALASQYGASLRSSLWVRDAGSWRLRFHQGTPAPSGS